MQRPAVFIVTPSRPDKVVIAKAARIIRSGGLVAFPTETVYGIAADLHNEEAIKRLYAAKKRPRNKPFTVHISGLAMIRSLGCVLTKEARALAKTFWPGPLTMVIRSKAGEKIGFRMPACAVALRLIKAAGVPVVAPSANVSGFPPPTDAAGVLSGMGMRIDAVVDGGRTDVGIESTVVDLTQAPFKILRQGAITKTRLKLALRLYGQNVG